MSRCLLSAICLLLPATASFLRAEEEPKPHPVVALGGSFQRPPVLRFLPGSKRTILYPALVGKDGIPVPVARDLGPKKWDLFLKESQERSSLLLSTLDPTMVRDSHGVIQMAVIVSEDPTASSFILTPGFLARFTAIFGPELLLAIPAGNRIYVFPKLANRLPDATGALRDDYLISPVPVSTEFFELSVRGLRAVGSFDPSDG